MSDFECADCKMLWRNYAEATTKCANLENQQRKAASMGYLSLFKDLTDQLRPAELQREECRLQISNHDQARHGTKDQGNFDHTATRADNVVAHHP
jgi:hypothetical protein